MKTKLQKKKRKEVIQKQNNAQKIFKIKFSLLHIV